MYDICSTWSWNSDRQLRQEHGFSCVLQLRTIVTVDMQAVEGKSVELPCNVTPPGHDKVYMVFWFRDDAGIPLYSFDVRGKPLSQARHWSAPEVFGSRAFFRTLSEPAQLVVEDIRLHDEGVYRCRVDFRNTPTRSFRYNLTVIVPPALPTIIDHWGRQLNATVGPHNEGDDVILTCRVIGGKPEPSVRWLVNGFLVDEEYEHNTGDVIENRLTWPSVKREDLNSVLTCQAINTVLTDPREISLVLDIHLRPLTVRILSKELPLVADRRYDVSCESAGSRPPAVITWYKGKRQLRRVKEETRENVTVSDLSFVPSTDDDGKSITCRAENPNITGAFLESSWKIDVVFPPIVSLMLGSTLNPDDIKEGDDVYFECHVKANPAWRKLSWLHNGVLLSHNQSARIIRSNQSLVLQKVTRQSAGNYVCIATNREGETVSNELTFRVKYAPTCRQERILVVGASRAESLDIACEVETDPPARSFKWKFNNSGETLEVSPERFAATSNGTMSVLRYTPVSELDYGTLSCWAQNAIGTQTSPCVFQVVAAGKPFPVRNCTLSNQTSSSVEVSCQPGFDGGLPQYFLLELYSADSGMPRYNLTSPDHPTFFLANLEPDVTFRIAVFAVNSKGRSPGIVLEEVTFRDAEKRTASDGELPISPILGMVVGAALTFISVVLLVVVKFRRSRSSGDQDSHQPHVEKHSGPNNTSLLHSTPSGKDLATSGVRDGPGDEKDPDIIPAKFATALADPVPAAARPLVGNGNVILRELSPPCSYPPQQAPLPHPKSLPISSHGPAGHWVSPGPAPVMDSACNQFPASGMSAYSWDIRPKDLRLPGGPSQALGSAAPSSSVAASADVELNGTAIKERLMANRLPESCV
ncbi:nephrin isoform X2 [Cryptotermes secundus]|uniref:nephrin isoform X2 n=1 Tax=Cryptotermes secundus TaxID=105785 RepID=UPI000CD7C423|nr:nephrin isoform X2 [Cryptotermes secundus]